jgi:hypothetical protein
MRLSGHVGIANAPLVSGFEILATLDCHRVHADASIRPRIAGSDASGW